MTMTPHDSIVLLDRSTDVDTRAMMADEVRTGLTAHPKTLSPKYFYDLHGSDLFEEITALPEYYQTRTEREILRRIAPELAGGYGFRHLIEFGSGSSEKTRILLDAFSATGRLHAYHPLDVSRDFLLETSDELARDYPGISILPVVGDFADGLDRIERDGPAMILFLGGTIGNLYPDETIDFLRRVARDMAPGDGFLIGLDLVKEPARLHAAYNDARGVTAAFNRNVLAVINRELDGTFDPERFDHYAFFNPNASRIEMHLISREDQTVRLGAIDLDVAFDEGESILTEISRKFTRATAERALSAAGLEVVAFHTDPEHLFAVVHAIKT